jgi:hypothetical protein
MHPILPSITAALAFAAAALIGSSSGARAQSAATPPHLIPQALQVEHEQDLADLTRIAKKKGPVGVEASKVLVLYKKHAAREEEFIFPPLTLLPLLADGKVTPDMAWAIPMTDRVRAEREDIFVEHTRLTDALNLLVVAAARAHDSEARAFAEAMATDSLNDLEILQPMLLLIGDILHSKLPAAH